MHVQVCTLDGCCEHQRTHLLTRSQQDVHMRLCMCSLFVQRWGNEDVGVQLGYEALVAWRGGLFLTEGRIRVLSVSSLFLTRAGVYVGVCVCIRTHTHTHTVPMGYSDVSPGVGMRHLEGPKNPERLNLGIYIFVYVCMYMLGGEMRSGTKCFFL